MRIVKLTLQYDGTDYVGWQRQDTGPSIQGVLEDALSRLEGRPVTVVGAGRTDAGAHALGQVASVRLEHPLEIPSLVRSLNATLPADVRVIGAADAPDDFHARHGARAKTYRYRIVTGEVVSPFERRYAWHVPQPLDLTAMLEAARPLEGRHDFAAFQATGSAPATSVRTVAELVLSRSTGEQTWYRAGGRAETPPEAIIELDITGDGFLRHMVRAIVGTLVEVGRRRRTPGSVAAALESRDRGRAGATAPAHGLFLVSVTY